MRVSSWLKVLFASSLVLWPFPAGGQDPSFAIVIIDWEPGTLKSQTRAYRVEADRSEVLFCVESWRKVSEPGRDDRIVISKVRRARGGQSHRLSDVGSECVAADGTSLPTIHTHSDGNCQFSASDLRTFAARRAAFEGVQCGDRHLIWITSVQVIALANGLEAIRTASSKESRQ